MSKAKISCEHKDYVTLTDGSSFRVVNHNEDDLMWRLTWAQDSITETDMLRLASMMDSYHYLMFECTQKRRNAVIKEIREAYREEHK